MIARDSACRQEPAKAAFLRIRGHTGYALRASCVIFASLIGVCQVERVKSSAAGDYGGNPGLSDNRAVADGGRCRRTLEAPARVNHNECVYVEVRKHRASCLIV